MVCNNTQHQQSCASSANFKGQCATTKRQVSTATYPSLTPIFFKHGATYDQTDGEDDDMFKGRAMDDGDGYPWPHLTRLSLEEMYCV